MRGTLFRPVYLRDLMKCPVCQKPMLALFTSYVCESCSRQPSATPDIYYGYAPGFVNAHHGATFYIYKTLQESVDFIATVALAGPKYVTYKVWCTTPLEYYQEPTKWLAYLTDDKALVGKTNSTFKIPYVGIASILP